MADRKASAGLSAHSPALTYAHKQAGCVAVAHAAFMMTTTPKHTQNISLYCSYSNLGHIRGPTRVDVRAGFQGRTPHVCLGRFQACLRPGWSSCISTGLCLHGVQRHRWGCMDLVGGGPCCSSHGISLPFPNRCLYAECCQASSRPASRPLGQLM
jgi:hypothetical protein